MKKTIGKFEISAYDPWPLWCTLIYNETKIRFSHEELTDLKHCVNELMRYAYMRLPERNHKEVEL